MTSPLPLTTADFATAMHRLGPFESAPVIAVAVSGGGDSMALLHLAHEWAQGQGGRVVAMTVDHGIRPESAQETATVAGWAAAPGIEHVALRWADPDPERGGLQSRARDARYALLGEEAARRGILHLLTAHHADDQAETVLLRLAKGSGPDGLAGMSALTFLPQVRLLRPLLASPGERLKETCRARGQNWLEDPSNTADRFARVRLRDARDILEKEGLSTAALVGTARQAGRMRAALERATASALARCVSVFPQGFAEIALDPWHAENPEVQRRGLAAVVVTIGDANYPPSPDALEGAGQGKQTLGGCLLETGGGRLSITRERRNLPPPQTLPPNQWTRWDRFMIRTAIPLQVAALENDLPADLPLAVSRHLAATQPALCDAHGIVAIPTLGYCRDPSTAAHFQARFSPRRSIAAAQFVVE